MRAAWMLFLVLAGAPLAGCIGSDGDDLDSQGASALDPASWAAPIPDVIRGLDHVGQALGPEGESFPGSGIWVEGNFAYVGGLSSGLRIIDVSEPEAPEVVGHLEGVYARDVDLIQQEGRLIAVLATNERGMLFADVTDPTAPEVVGAFSWARVHNIAVVPDTNIVYGSTGRKHIQNPIVDATDPANPVFRGTFGQFSCHDLSFWANETKQRAYCAGNQVSTIWDVADPLVPGLVATVHNPCMDHRAPAPGLGTPELDDGVCGGFHHSAFVNEDASILILGDEYRGATEPGCFAHVETAAGSKSSPIGALWFYDISTETAPELVGWFSPPAPAEAYAAEAIAHAQGEQTIDPLRPTRPVERALSALPCTSHFGDLVPGHEAAVVAWYLAGTLVVDFSDPANPVLVDQFNEGTDTWDARVHNGYVFTGDQLRGLDVLTFV